VDLVQPPGECGGDRGKVGAGMFAGDGAHGIDMLLDEAQRNASHVRRVLDQPAQTVGDRADRRVAERGGLALNVMRGAKQFVVRNFIMPGPSVLRLLTFLVVVFAMSVADLVLAAALLPAPALADILPYGSGRRPPPPPRPFGALEPIFLEKIRASGFDCPQIDEISRRAPSTTDPVTHEGGQDLAPYTVTCGNGKQFVVTLAPDGDTSRGAVAPLN
jgi:hypothetical protein